MRGYCIFVGKYCGMTNSDISADKVMPEFTPVAIIIGIIMSIVFGAANAYIGLRVGMTISASIPAAVISMGIIRGVMKRDSILENNMVQIYERLIQYMKILKNNKFIDYL